MELLTALVMIALTHVVEHSGAWLSAMDSKTVSGAGHKRFGKSGDDCKPANEFRPGDQMPADFKHLFQLGPNDEALFDSCGHYFIDMFHTYGGYQIYNSFAPEWFRAVYDKKRSTWTPYFPEPAHLNIDTLPNAADILTRKPSKQVSVDACRRYLNISSKLPVAHVNRYVLVYDVMNPAPEIVTTPSPADRMKFLRNLPPGIYNPVLADHVMIWKQAQKSTSASRTGNNKPHHFSASQQAYPWYSCFYDTFAEQVIPWQV